MSQTIKTAINANIKRNGNQEITGQKLNSILIGMVDDADGQIEGIKSRTTSLETKTSGITKDVNNNTKIDNISIFGLNEKVRYIREEDSTTIVGSDSVFEYDVEVGVEGRQEGGNLNVHNDISVDGYVKLGQGGILYDGNKNLITEHRTNKTKIATLEGKTTSISHSGSETKVNDDLRVETRILLNEDNEGEDLEIKAELDQDDYKMIMKLGSASMGENGAIVRHILTPKQSDDATPKSYVDSAITSGKNDLVINRITPIENKITGITKASNGHTKIDGIDIANFEDTTSENLGAVMVKTQKISYANNATTILGQLNVGDIAVDADMEVSGAIIAHDNINVSGDVTCDNGAVSLTEIAQKVNDLVGGEITSTLLGNYYVLNGVITPLEYQICKYIRVAKGLTYTIKVYNSSSAIVGCRYGFFTSIPTNGSTTSVYGGGSVAEAIVFTADNDGYLAYSCYAPNLVTETIESNGVIIGIKNDVNTLKERVGTGSHPITMENGYYVMRNLQVGDTFSTSVSSGGTYKHASIPCNEGDVFNVHLEGGSTAGQYCFTDSSLSILEIANSGDAVIRKIVAPENSAFLFIVDNSNSTSYYEDEGAFAEIKTDIETLGKKIDNSFKCGKDSFTLAQNASKTLSSTYVRKGLNISLSVGAFSKVRFGVGYGAYMGYYIEIDSTKIYVYKNNGSANVEVTNYAHSLNISNGVNCTISQNNIDTNSNTISKASIIVTDSLGSVSKNDDIEWWGGGSAFVTNLGTSSISGNISFFPSDIVKDIWLFGDSYFSWNSNERWLYYILNYGHNNWLANHLPGINSANSLVNLKALIALSKPKYIVWCLGMNDTTDASNTTPSNDYKTVIDEVISICEENDIKLVLGTIPTSKNDNGTGLKNNEGKNYWIRSSGYRYIDFANAVGANGDGTWRSGLKATDIHPSRLGAKVLASQALIDFPEIME